MRVPFTVAGAVIVLLLALTPAVAQDASDSGSKEPILAPNIYGTSGGFNLSSAQTPEKGTWTFGLYYNNFDRMVQRVSCLMEGFTSDWSYNHTRTSASIGYSPLDNLELSLMLPQEDFEGDQTNSFGTILGREYVDEIETDGLGNLRLGLKWRLFENGRSAFALNGFVELPTGDEDKGVAADDTGLGLGFNYNVGNFLINLGYRDRGDAASGGGAGPDPNNDIDLKEEIFGGIGYIHPVSHRLDWITELDGTTYQGDDPRPPDFLDLTSGIRMRFGASSNWSFNAAARFNVVDYGDTDGFGGLVGVTYSRRPTPPPPPPPPPPQPLPPPPEPEQYRLMVTKQGNGLGSVTSQPAGIDCGGTCSATFVEGTAVTLTARADRGSTFDGWGGDPDCSDGRVTMDGNRACIATFGMVPPAPKPPKVIESVCLFASSSTRVDNRCQKILDREVALQMRDEPDSTALIIGYSDSTGSDAVNQRLSQRRAEAVKQMLVTRHGIDASRISIEGHGAADPVADNSTAEGRAKNRRAVIRLTIMQE